MVPVAVATAALVGAGVLVGTHLGQSSVPDRVTVRVIDDGAAGGPRVVSTQVVPFALMANPGNADWRPPTIQDRERLNALLRDVAIQLRTNAEMFEQAEQDLRAIGGDSWSIEIGRYPARAERCRELATWVEDELGVFRGGHQRQVPLDGRGMFPGMLA